MCQQCGVMCQFQNFVHRLGANDVRNIDRKNPLRANRMAIIWLDFFGGNSKFWSIVATIKIPDIPANRLETGQKSHFSAFRGGTKRSRSRDLIVWLEFDWEILARIQTFLRVLIKPKVDFSCCWCIAQKRQYKDYRILYCIVHPRIYRWIDTYG